MNSGAQRRARDGGERRSAIERARERWGVARLRRQEMHGGDRAGEVEDLARILHRALRHRPVVLLHDRLVDDGSIIDHIAIGPGGLTVIADARDLEPPLSVQTLRGAFGRRRTTLHDAGGDRTDRLQLVRAQIRELSLHVPVTASIRGALCLGEPAQQPILPIEAEGVLVGDARAVADLANRNSERGDVDVPELVDRLDRALEPVFSRDRPSPA